MMFDIGSPDIDTLLFNEMEAVCNRSSYPGCRKSDAERSQPAADTGPDIIGGDRN